jgi:hypothetical protein
MLDRGHDPGASFFLSFFIVELKQKFCPAAPQVLFELGHHFDILILEGTAQRLLPACFILCKKSNPVYSDSVKWARNPDSTEPVMSVLMSMSSNEQTKKLRCQIN